MLGAIDLFDDPLQLPALGRALHDDFLSELGPPAFLTLPLGDERAYNCGTADATGALNGGITTVPGGFGALGAAWKLNGSTGYVSFPSAPNISGECSLVVVCSLAASASTYLFGDANAGATAEGFLVGLNASNAFRVLWGGSVITTGVSRLTLNTTYMLTAVRTGSSGSWNLNTYINSTPDVSLTAIATNPSTTQQLVIGRFGGFSGNYFNGSVYAAGVFPPLSASQVSSLYAALLTGEPFPLFAPQTTTRYFPLSAGGPQSVPLPTVDVAVSALAPTVTLGPVAPAATTIDVVVSVVTPAVSLGAISQAAGTIDILLSAIAPAVTLGPPTIVVPTIDVAVSAIAPTIALGGVSETAGLVDISLAPIAPTVALGPVLQSAPAVAIVVDTNPPAISLGPAAAAAGIASITLDASAPAITLGSVSVAAPGLDVLIDLIAPATQVQAVPLSVVDLALSAVAPTPGFVGAYPTIDVWELSARDTVWILEP